MGYVVPCSGEVFHSGLEQANVEQIDDGCFPCLQSQVGKGVGSYLKQSSQRGKETAGKRAGSPWPRSPLC